MSHFLQQQQQPQLVYQSNFVQLGPRELPHHPCAVLNQLDTAGKEASGEPSRSVSSELEASGPGASGRRSWPPADVQLCSCSLSGEAFWTPSGWEAQENFDILADFLCFADSPEVRASWITESG